MSEVCVGLGRRVGATSSRGKREVRWRRHAFQASVQRMNCFSQKGQPSAQTHQTGRSLQTKPPLLTTTIMSTSRNGRFVPDVNQRKGSDDGSKSALLYNKTLTRLEIVAQTNRHRQEQKTDQNTSTFYRHNALSGCPLQAGWVAFLFPTCPPRPAHSQPGASSLGQSSSHTTQAVPEQR